MPWTANVRIPNQKSKSSPALTEFRGELHMVHAGDSSNLIWHSVFDGTNWSPNDPIPDQKSKAPSALASFQDRLHLTHLGDTSNRIWHSSFDGTRWTTNVPIEDELSQASPAMAVFQNRLHLLHIGNTSHRIFHLEFDGLRWQRRGENEGLENQRSNGAVALAVFNGELHMVHQGDTSNRLFHTRFDGTGWSENVPIEGQLSKSPPALAELNGLLHLLHLGDTSNRIWHSTFDGNGFASNIPIPYQLSKAAPALASFGGRIHMTHLGDSSNDIWHSSSDGVLVRHPDRRVIVVDIDGVRWDSFYRHLKRVRDAGASTDVTYTFSLPPGASDETVLGDGNVQLRSALGELCFADGNGMVDVRLALAPYPSFTFPSHGTMYTGTSPGQHGITGHTFMVRDAPPEWDRHSWDSPPRALALQGYCTDADTDAGVAADYFWGGFDTVGENSCRNRNRGLVSDLRVANLFERAHDGGLRSCSIHGFYHGALRPWEGEGKDQWWRYSPPELRSIKDICSEEDLDQLETVDHGSLTKAELLLESMPSKVRVQSPPPIPPSIPGSADPKTGERRPGWRVTGEPHPDGIPDLVAIYLASVDNASHINGIRDQETYLAWFDHRLAGYVRALRGADPDTFENTVFAFITDHGHSPIAQAPETSGVPSNNTLAVREELVRILMGDQDGQDFLDLAAEISRRMYGYGYKWLVSEAIEDDFGAWAQAMNLYVYVRNPDLFPPLDVAARLLKIPMRTEPYAALVLVRGQYQFLARGETSAVALSSTACRAIVVPQLDVPPASTAEVEETSLSQADADAERDLRDRLRTDEAFPLLQVAERVAGFQPVGINQSPDVVLLAPAGRSFSGGASTHGSFAYSTSRIPMVFCGPGMPPRRTTMDGSRMIDFAPTVLSLLGLTAEGMEGRPLLDRSGQVLRRPTPSGPAPKPSASCPSPSRRPPAVAPPRRLPRVRVILHPSVRRPATTDESSEASKVPALISIRLHRARVRREVVLGDPSHVEVRRATSLVVGREEAWLEAGGKRQDLKSGASFPIDADQPVRIGSKRSYGVIEVQASYVVVPLTIDLPRVPGWLRRVIDDLARASRILMDDPDLVDRSILVTAREFEVAARVLEAQFDAADASVEGEAAGGPRPIPVVEGQLSAMASVIRGVRILKSLLERPTVVRLDTTPARLCSV